MSAEEAISRLSSALALLSRQEFDKETIRMLTKDVADEKHQHYIEQGLISNDKSLIMHGIIGALSHYEAEKEKERFAKKIHSLKEDH